MFHKEAFFHPHSSTYTPQTYLLLANTTHNLCRWHHNYCHTHQHKDSKSTTYSAQAKRTCTTFTPVHAGYNTRLKQQINTVLDMYTHPKILCLTLDPILAYSKHNTVAKAFTNIPILTPFFDQVGQTQGDIALNIQDQY